MSDAHRLTRSVTVHRFERTHWAAVFTGECGFSSAARLKRLFPSPFQARTEDVLVRENDVWDTPLCVRIAGESRSLGSRLSLARFLGVSVSKSQCQQPHNTGMGSKAL